jgi:hypothetical protein
MQDTFEKARVDATDMLRKAAGRYGTAVLEYGHAVSDFADGKISFAEVAAKSLNIAIRESKEAAAAGASITEEYYRKALTLVGITAVGHGAKSGQKPHAAGRRTRRVRGKAKRKAASSAK